MHNRLKHWRWTSTEIHENIQNEINIYQNIQTCMIVYFGRTCSLHRITVPNVLFGPRPPPNKSVREVHMNKESRRSCHLTKTKADPRDHPEQVKSPTPIVSSKIYGIIFILYAFRALPWPLAQSNHPPSRGQGVFFTCPLPSFHAPTPGPANWPRQA